MLRELYIKNVAVIEDVHIEFGSGLNVLTGETGAGKSIIIDSINMILGERSSRDFVRHNADRAKVQAVFDADASISALCTEMGAEAEDDCIILSRDITADGKSTARINGTVVPLSSMRVVASALVNIHGQHDNQALLSPACHIDFLDEYAKNQEQLQTFSNLYNRLKELGFKIDELKTGEKEKAERADLLRFQIDEIKSADLTPGEYEDLTELREKILNAEKISECANGAYNVLYNSEGMGCAYDAVSVAISQLEAVVDYSKTLASAYSSLQDAKYAIEDVAQSVREYAETVEFDKAALDETVQILDLLNRLKRKYATDISGMIKYLHDAEAELEMLSDVDGTISKLSKEEQSVLQEMEIAGQALTATRKKAIEEINIKITDALHQLNMEHAQFSVELKKTEATSKGVDQVQFMIRTNGGEPLKPLAKIASGGELSRTMLALKSILSDGVDTMIFDEIDTGVSGMAAKKIAVKLFEISVNKQVLCITHLPQLASMCDHHFLIKKSTSETIAKTSVVELDDDSRVLEIARLSGGDITDVSKAHAKELLDGCEAYKRRKTQ